MLIQLILLGHINSMDLPCWIKLLSILISLSLSFEPDLLDFEPVVKSKIRFD